MTTATSTALLSSQHELFRQTGIDYETWSLLCYNTGIQLLEHVANKFLLTTSWVRQMSAKDQFWQWWRYRWSFDDNALIRMNTLNAFHVTATGDITPPPSYEQAKQTMLTDKIIINDFLNSF